MRGSRKFCQRGTKLTFFLFCFLLVDEGREDPSTTISGPSSAHQQNAIMAFPWRADDGPTLNAGLVAAIFRGSGTVLLENSICLDPLSPTLDPP